MSGLQIFLEIGQERWTAALGDTQHLSQRGYDPPRLGDRREHNQEYTVRELIEGLSGHLQREARFAAASCAGQGYETAGLKQTFDFG